MLQPCVPQYVEMLRIFAQILAEFGGCREETRRAQLEAEEVCCLARDICGHRRPGDALLLTPHAAHFGAHFKEGGPQSVVLQPTCTHEASRTGTHQRHPSASRLINH